MHALIINGSPRVKKYSNTDKILERFTFGMKDAGCTFEQYEISDRLQWDTIRERFYTEGMEHILIAMPLYVECIPGLLLEFLETLEIPEPPKTQVPLDGPAPAGETTDPASGTSTAPAPNMRPKLSFILQGGFSEGIQLRCGEEFLKKLAPRLGCEYGGTLVKGDNFSIRLVSEEDREKITSPYEEMGRIYGRTGAFEDEACKAFTGPEVFPLPIRILVGLLFKTALKKTFKKTAKEWGCARPLTDRPYES